MDLQTFLNEWRDDSPTLLVRTSGSTGRPKPMRVEKRRMEASARITCRFLRLQRGDTALLCLPLDYIAGKMMVVRALTCGLHLLDVPPTGHPLASLPPFTGAAEHPDIHIDLAAMVPLQVYNSLQVPVERSRLMAVRHLLIGGGAVDEAMEETLGGFPNAVWSTYGMTETLSHIALRRLNGPEASAWFTPFDGVAVTQDGDGCLIVDAPAVHEGPLATNDIAELRGDGTFRILGRKDNVVCCGGMKIQMEELERLLRPHIHDPFLIARRADDKFGEIAVLLTEGAADAAREACAQALPKMQRPRAYLHVDHIPLTATGKPARRQADAMACSGRPCASPME